LLLIISQLKPVYAIEEQGNFITIKLKGLKVVISKNPFRISYYNKANQLLIAENKASQGNMEGASLNFSVSPDEVFYGGGSRALGMNRRGNRLKLFNEPHYGYQNRAEVLNYSLPVYDLIQKICSTFR
jgi:oligosaccharide 4-alpha-D-glucosyltransferase